MRIDERSRAHKKFLNDDSDIMVATLAYGMGIDKKVRERGGEVLPYHLSCHIIPQPFPSLSLSMIRM